MRSHANNKEHRSIMHTKENKFIARDLLSHTPAHHQAHKMSTWPGKSEIPGNITKCSFLTSIRNWVRHVHTRHPDANSVMEGVIPYFGGSHCRLWVHLRSKHPTGHHINART